MTETEGRLTREDGATVAYRQRPGAAPGVLFCGGFHSDMTGAKASFLSEWCAARGRAFTRFDYRGHGASSGRFEDGTIGTWFDDALAVLDAVAAGPRIVVGSSMGGWMALMLARARPARVAGLVLLAPAPDFPRRLILPALPSAALAALEADGRWDRPSAYGDEAYPLTWKLIAESRDHELLDGPPIPVAGPVHILHGDADPDVPWRHGRRCLDIVDAPEAVLHLIKGADHRLSSPGDLARLGAILEAMG